jgi:cytochrome c oxidase subunit 2
MVDLYVLWGVIDILTIPVGEIGERIARLLGKYLMSAILPPAERLWWKHPLDRVEGTWIAIAFVWCMIMFFMMIYWHACTVSRISRPKPTRPLSELFAAKAQKMVDQYTVRS